MPSEIERAAAEARRQIASAEEPYRTALARLYDRTIQALEADLILLERRMAQARANGETISPSWLQREARYRQLLHDAEREFARFADDAFRIVDGVQVMAVRGGAVAATDLMSAAGVTGGRVNTRAVESALGSLTSAPVRRSLARYGAEGAQTITDTLLDGIARGRSPWAIIRDIRRNLTSPVNQARLEATIRTESMRAYRASMNEQYASMGNAIAGYRWMAAKSRRTCLACLARDGMVQEEPWDQMHILCRCISSPVARGSTAPYQSGEDWLRGQPEDVQRRMMPTEAAWQAWRDGAIGLSDFVGVRQSRTWGPSVYQRSGREALERTGA